MRPIENMLIVGGGIAGFSAAIAARLAGIEVALVEADPNWATVGVGLIFQPSALRAVQRLGILDDILRQGFGYSGTRALDADGRVVFETTEGPRLAGATAPSAAGLPRPALAEILRKRAIELGANVAAGMSVSGLTLGADHVEARLSDGRLERYDLVVGADGIYSSVRRMVFDQRLEPEFTGQGVWRFTTGRLPELTSAWLCRGPGGSAGLIPLTADTMYLFYVESGVTADRRLLAEELAPTLARLLSSFGGPIASVAARLSADSDIVYRPFEWLLTPPPWHRGRVLLIGDAAHASTAHLGAGGGLAIEDAVILGELLASRMDPDDLLQAFMARRYDRCIFVASRSHLLGEIEQGKIKDMDAGEIARQVFERLAEPI